MSDLTVYVTAWHNTIFYVSRNTSGFAMQRTRVTANSFFGGNGPGKGRSTAANVSWGLRDPGDMLVLHVRKREVVAVERHSPRR